MTDQKNTSNEKANTSPNKPMPEDVLNAAQDPQSIKDPLKEELDKAARAKGNEGNRHAAGHEEEGRK